MHKSELAEVISALKESPKHLPVKYLYDERGSQLFEQICEQPEYYPTRTEIKIIKDNIQEIVDQVGEQAEVIEFGSGNSDKIRTLLGNLSDPVAYIPLDVSEEILQLSAEKLRVQFPSIEVLPVCADYTQHVELPTPTREAKNKLMFFPGSTIGNFYQKDAEAFLKRFREWVAPDGGLILGVDMIKDPKVIEAAYNDANGVTRDFNLNLLTHLNRALGLDFKVENFKHQAVWDEGQNRIEISLLSQVEQAVKVGDETFEIKKGEKIITEYSHKYSNEHVDSLAAKTGFKVIKRWLDENQYFSLQYLKAV